MVRNLRMDVLPITIMGMRMVTMIAVMTTAIPMIMIVMTPTIVMATTMILKTIVTGSTLFFQKQHLNDSNNKTFIHL